jgi:imidazolonepropionase-like amidohydrolase
MIPPILILLHLAGALAATRSATVQACLPGQPIAISGVEVLTLKDSLVGPRVTVLVDAGRIAAVGTPSIPANACRIDGTGRVLLPGLADMHAHTNERELPLFLANGVTLVRELNGSPNHLALREQIANGTVVGPRLVVGSPLLTGKALRFRHRLITSAEDARAAAREAKDASYDFLKIYDDLTAEQYAAFVEAGRTLGLPLDGHVPAAVGLERVLVAGQAIQHIDKITFALMGHSPDSALLPEARRLFAGRRAWVTPTLASLRALDRSGTAEYAARFARPEMAYVDSATIAWWGSLRRDPPRPAADSRVYRFYVDLLRVLGEAGARFLLGTDAANPMMIAGFSVHEEMETLVRDAGWTPLEALRSATLAPAEFLGDSLGGCLRVGCRADLVLVERNPLADLTVLRRPAGVVVAGRWMDRAALEEGLRRVAGDAR